MALATNTKQQMIKRLKRDLELAHPEISIVDSPDVSGNPGLMLSIASVDVSHILLKSKSFNGFNVVAELSSSAAEGLPETDLYLQIDTNAAGMSYDVAAKIMHKVTKIGCSVTKLIASTASPAAANAIDANVTSEIANDARLGAVGA